MSMNEYQQSLMKLKEKSVLLSGKLNFVSNEIKNLEISFQESGIGVDYHFEFNNELDLNDEERSAFTVKTIPGWKFLNAKVKEGLSWERDFKSGKFRLLYSRIMHEERVAFNGSYAPDGEFTTVISGSEKFPDGVSLKKPLIECSLDVRLRAWKQIPKFINGLTSALSNALEDSNV